MSRREQVLVRVLAILSLVAVLWLGMRYFQEQTSMTAAERAERCNEALAEHAEYPVYFWGHVARHHCRCGPPSRHAPVDPNTAGFVTPGLAVNPDLADPACHVWTQVIPSRRTKEAEVSDP